MRKLILAFLCSVVLFNFTGRGNSNSSGRTENKPAGVVDVIEAGMAEEDSKKSDTENQISKSIPGNSTDGIDVDLTALSSTMVYSEVYNMLLSPDDYIGKTVKMDGTFAYYHDDSSDKDYFACIISDATACCSQGIEFMLTDDYSYPDDYPEEGGNICVVGVFDTYREGDYTYFTLRDATLV